MRGNRDRQRGRYLLTNDVVVSAVVCMYFRNHFMVYVCITYLSLISTRGMTATATAMANVRSKVIKGGVRLD